jgi:hypothetical protein
MGDTLRPDSQGILVDTYGSQQFSRDVIQGFPELLEELGRSTGLLHVQVATLAESVRRALDAGDLDSARRPCTFLDATLDKPKVSSEMMNAIAISFLTQDELQATSAGRDLLARMPERIETILREQADRGRTRT